MSIHKAGELVEHLIAAVQGHGAQPHTDIRVRIGTIGPTYRIAALHGSQDMRGFSLLLVTEPAPESF